MFDRNIQEQLISWSSTQNRKPLVLRGARQVGKTTVVDQFSKNFDTYVYLNLEKEEDKNIFSLNQKLEQLILAIFLVKNKKQEGRILLFIDEIQESKEAIKQLRYFFEERPELYVIAAGSMLETIFDQNINFPVGRVDFIFLRPVCFIEFLNAIGEEQAVEIFDSKMPFPEYGLEKLFNLFHEYALIGGMPEVVQFYSKRKDLVALRRIYESLVNSYIGDIEKYSKSTKSGNVIRDVFTMAFLNANQRIHFNKLAGTNYGGREVGAAFRSLEKVLLLHLIYPTLSTELPLQPSHRKAPKLQVLDTGLMSYQLGLQENLIGVDDLNNVYKGNFIEHLVGQELLASRFEVSHRLNFWVRDKKGSDAEIDFIVNYKGNLIPIEVKSGATGKLKSLHIYMGQAPHKMAVRLYRGEVRIDEIRTISGEKYMLMSLPYFLAFKIDKYLDWFESEIQ